MTTIKESILTSTGTGAEGTILRWAKTYLKDRIYGGENSMVVEKINNKYYLVFDNFQYQDYFNSLCIGRADISPDFITKMPKLVSGILCKKRITNDTDQMYKIVYLKFINCDNITIDLSQFDYEIDGMEYSLFDDIFSFFYCKHIKLKGVPEKLSKKDDIYWFMRIDGENTSFDEIHINSKNCYIILSDNVLDNPLPKMKDCVLKGIKLNQYCLSKVNDPTDLDFLIVNDKNTFKDRYVFKQEYCEMFDEFTKNNKCEIIRILPVKLKKAKDIGKNKKEKYWYIKN